MRGQSFLYHQTTSRRAPMQRKHVTARMIKSIGWENKVLEVEYHSGLIHQYHDVSEEEYIRVTTGSIDKKIRLIGKSHQFTKVKGHNL